MCVYVRLSVHRVYLKPRQFRASNVIIIIIIIITCQKGGTKRVIVVVGLCVCLCPSVRPSKNAAVPCVKRYYYYYYYYHMPKWRHKEKKEEKNHEHERVTISSSKGEINPKNERIERIIFDTFITRSVKDPS